VAARAIAVARLRKMLSRERQSGLLAVRGEVFAQERLLARGALYVEDRRPEQPSMLP